jgi:hypothetical protein
MQVSGSDLYRLLGNPDAAALWERAERLASLVKHSRRSKRREPTRAADGLLSLDEAAGILGYSTSGLRKIVRRTRNGQTGAAIQFCQVGNGPIRFRREWLDTFIAANATAPQRDIPMPMPKAVRCNRRSTASSGRDKLAAYFP